MGRTQGPLYRAPPLRSGTPHVCLMFCPGRGPFLTKSWQDAPRSNFSASQMQKRKAERPAWGHPEGRTPSRASGTRETTLLRRIPRLTEAGSIPGSCLGTCTGFQGDCWGVCPKPSRGRSLPRIVRSLPFQPLTCRNVGFSWVFPAFLFRRIVRREGAH